jgi:hypothetical protein
MPTSPPTSEFPYGKPTAEPMYLVDNSGNPLIGISTNLTGPVGTNPYTVTVSPQGELRVAEPSTSLFFDSFGTGTLDITNNWKPPTASGGGTAASNAAQMTVLGSGTTIAGYSYLESVPSFPEGSSGLMKCSLALSIEFPVLLNAYRFWGSGTNPGTPTTAAPLTNAVGFEIYTDGKLYAVIYTSGVRTVVQDLSVTTGTGKQPQNFFPHIYSVFLRGDHFQFFIDGSEIPCAQTVNSQPAAPVTDNLPVKVLCVAGSPAPTSSATVSVSAVIVNDIGRMNFQISDGVYGWRKATVDGSGNLAVKSSVGVSGGATTFHVISAATTNATSIKAGAGQVYGYSVYNANAAVRFVKLFNKASAPTLGTDVPARTISIPPATQVAETFENGLAYPLGIALATTALITDLDTTAVALSDLSINLDYK